MNCKKRGRPRGEGGRTIRFNIRVTDEELEMLDYASKTLGVSKSDILRKGIKGQYQLAKIRAES